MEKSIVVTKTEWSAAVAETRFKKHEDGGWMVVGPSLTAGQALDGKDAIVDVTKRGGEISAMVRIINSRRYYVDDKSGEQIWIADVARDLR